MTSRSLNVERDINASIGAEPIERCQQLAGVFGCLAFDQAG